MIGWDVEEIKLISSIEAWSILLIYRWLEQEIDWKVGMKISRNRLKSGEMWMNYEIRCAANPEANWPVSPPEWGRVEILPRKFLWNIVWNIVPYLFEIFCPICQLVQGTAWSILSCGHLLGGTLWNAWRAPALVPVSGLCHLDNGKWRVADWDSGLALPRCGRGWTVGRSYNVLREQPELLVLLS